MIDFKDEELLQQELVKINDFESLRTFSDLFKLHNAKQDIIRINKVTKLIGKMEDEIQYRIEESPEEIPGKDLTSYYNAVLKSIDISKENIEKLINPENPFQLNLTQNNLNLLDIPKESKDNIFGAVQNLLTEMANGNKDLIPNTPLKPIKSIEPMEVIIEEEEVEDNNYPQKNNNLLNIDNEGKEENGDKTL